MHITRRPVQPFKVILVEGWRAGRGSHEVMGAVGSNATRSNRPMLSPPNPDHAGERRAHRVRQVTALVCPRSDLSYILSTSSTRRYTTPLTPVCISYHLNHSSSVMFPQSPHSPLIPNNFCYQFNNTSRSLYDLLNSFNAYTLLTSFLFLYPTW